MSTWRRLRSELTPATIISAIVVVASAAIVVFAPAIAPHGEAEILTDGFLPPGGGMLLGTDFLGRDVLSRLIYGMRVTLSVAFAISLLAFLIGSTLGFLTTVTSGLIDMILSRMVDALISFPSIMIALIVISSLGSSIPVLIFTVALIDATRVFRVARALGMGIMVQDYIEAAKVRGEGLLWIMWHEILPNALPPLMAEFGIRFTYAILFISALSFLGLGVQPPHADLGLMVKENLPALLYGGFAPLYPAICIAVVAVSVNMLVDWYLKSSGASLPDEL